MPKDPDPVVKDEEEKVVCKMSVTDYHRMKIEKMFKNPTKALASVEQTKQTQKPKAPPDFIRNVWGSSSGVGSGDFHVYRGVRRREFMRRDCLEKELEKERLDAEHAEKKKAIEEAANEKAAKKRKKRLKKKENMKKKRKLKGNHPDSTSSDSDENDGQAKVSADEAEKKTEA